MALDHTRRAILATTFNHIGIQRALHQKFRIRQTAGVLLENAHKQLANCFAFCFGFSHTSESLKKSRTGVDMYKFYAHHTMKSFNDLRTFVFAHQASVNINTSQLFADRAVHQRRSNCRIDTTRQTTNNSLASDLLTYCLNLRVDHRVHCPSRLAPSKLQYELLQNFGALLGVHYFRVKLHTPNLSRSAFDDRHWCIRSGRSRNKTFGHSCHRIEVAHPNI